MFLSNIIEYIKFILCIYFTAFPYSLYKYSTNMGNLGITGIALGFINGQIIFCVTIIFTCLIIYYKNSLLNILFLIWCYIYILSLNKIIYLINLIKNKVVIY